MDFPNPPSQYKHLKIGLGLFGFLLLAGFALLFNTNRLNNHESLQTTDSSEPTITNPAHSSQFLNTKPGVHFVGSPACATCHEKISESYQQHPMSRSMSLANDATPVEKWDAGSHSKFNFGSTLFQADNNPPTMVHTESLIDVSGKITSSVSEKISWIVGSGARGRAYIVDHDGYWFQSPLAWYSASKRWNLSPQYEKSNLHFTRPITQECLFCHCTSAEPVQSSINHYSPRGFHEAAIGCERCHGPGELHVAARTSNPTAEIADPTIANPSRMSPELREDLCWQCHLQSTARVVRFGKNLFDYRPGLPLDEFVVDFMKSDHLQNEPQFVGTVPQMITSRCYQSTEGDNKLGCTSCHDPHYSPKESDRSAYYRKRCLNCHKQDHCTGESALRKEKDNNCIACHMPASQSAFPHLAGTDHRVLKNPIDPKVRTTNKSIVQAENPLIPLRGTNAGKYGREMGIALQILADKSALPNAQRYARLAIPHLRSATLPHANDIDALYAEGKSLWYIGQKTVALRLFSEILQRFPNEENILYNASVLAIQLGETKKSTIWSGRLIELNPWRWEYFKLHSDAMVASGDMKAAERSHQMAKRLNPTGYQTK